MMINGTRYRWPVLWAAFFSYLIDSYDLIVLAIAMPVLLKVLHMSLPEGGLLGSATMAGAIAGSVLFGLIAENRGKRFSLVLALIWLGIGMGAVYLVNSWMHWMILRFFTGLALGGLWGPCAALIAEHWSPQYRGRAASFVFSSFAIGASLASWVGRMVLSVQWQLLFLTGAISIPIAFLVFRLTPSDAQRLSALDQVASSSLKVGIGAIFTRDIMPKTMMGTLISVVNLAGYWGAAFWIPTFLTTERGLSLATMAGFSFVMYIGMFLGFQFFGILSDWVGRRKSMISAFLTAAIAVAVYVVVHQPMFLFWWGIAVGFGLCGVGGVLGAYYAELFPDHLRAYAGGFCWNMGRIGAVLAPYTIGYVGRMHGLQTGLALTSGVYVIGAIILFFMPETFRCRNADHVSA